MQTTSNGRVRRTEQEWREILARCTSSGLSPREFCRQEDLHLTSFQRWQKKLSLPSTRDEFVTVSPEPAPEPPWTVEVLLPHGCTLRFRG